MDRARRRNKKIARARLLYPEKYKGRPANNDRNNAILKLRKSGHSIAQISKLLNCSKSTVQRSGNIRSTQTNF